MVSSGLSAIATAHSVGIPSVQSLVVGWNPNKGLV